MLPMPRYRVYTYQWHFLWLGFVIMIRKPEDRYFWENTPLEQVFLETKVDKVTIGFSMQSVQNRLLKYCQKCIKKEKEK